MDFSAADKHAAAGGVLAGVAQVGDNTLWLLEVYKPDFLLNKTIVHEHIMQHARLYSCSYAGEENQIDGRNHRPHSR